jgi:CDP-diacylglycerol--serine O-phosphatidyltransferase
MLLQQRLDHTIKRIKGQSANIFTLLNLILGTASILVILHEELRLSLLFIFLAALFDRFDGMIARKLSIESAFGKQLDSLCDIISFGIAPAFLMYQAILYEFGLPGAFFTILYIICGAIRLARFNVIEFSGHYIGLPITAAGCFLTFSFLFIKWFPPFFFMFLTLILSFLMISTLQIKKR